MSNMIAWFRCNATEDNREDNQTEEFIATFHLDRVLAITCSNLQDKSRRVYLVGGLSFYIHGDDVKRLEDALLSPVSGRGYLTA